MTEFKNQVKVNAVGDVDKKASRWGRALDRFSSMGKRSLSTLSRSLPHLSRGFDALSNRYTALLTGGAAFAAVKNAAAMETRLARLGIAADKSNAEMRTLNEEIYKTAQNRSINVSADEIMSGLEQIVAKTGNFDAAAANIKNLGMVISATGASGQDAGAMIADLIEKFGIKTPDELLQTLDLLASQGKEGAFELADLATQGNRVMSAYAGIGRTGKTAAAELGALTQIIRKGVGSSEQSATALEAYMRALNDVQTRKRLKSVGVSLFEKDDPKKMRSAVDIMKDVIVKAKGNVSKIGRVFKSNEAMRAFSAASLEYKETGGFASLDSFMGVKADGSTLVGDSERMAATFESSVLSLKTALERFSNAALAEPIKNLADALNRIDPEKLQTAIKAGAVGIGAIGTMVVAKKGFDIAKGAYGIFTDIFGKGKGNGIAGALSGDVQKVYVVNMPGGGFGGADGGGFWGDVGGAGKKTGKAGKIAKAGRIAKAGKAGKAAKNLSRFGKMKNFLGKGGKFLSKAAVPLMIAGTVADLATADDNSERGSALGGFGGTLGGAKAGALLGTMIMPGVGTAAGSLIGGGLGYLSGSWLGKKIGGWFDGDKKEEKAEIQKPVKDGKIRIVFDNAPKGMRVENDLDFVKIEINTGLTEA